MLGNLKWPILGYLAIYLGLIVTRNSPLWYTPGALSSARRCCNDIDRKVDISDSRLSNFDSDSDERDLNSSELLAVDRVFPLTKTLNRIMDKICRKLSLQVTLEDKKHLSLTDNLNLTYMEDDNKNDTERQVYGRNALVSRLDSLKRLGNAYIIENTDTTIVIVQKLQFRILKLRYDFYNEESAYLGGCSFTFSNNLIVLSIELSTSYDNSGCAIREVSFSFAPDKRSFTLTIDGLSGAEGLYRKLKSFMYERFINKVTPAIENELLPILVKLVDQSNICSYFDAGDHNFINIAS